MTTPEECICCVEVPAVHSQMLSEDMQCITDSDIFISNCHSWEEKDRYGANVNERTSHIRCDWLIKNRHLYHLQQLGHTHKIQQALNDPPDKKQSGSVAKILEQFFKYD
jgi:hypothetical protein